MRDSAEAAVWGKLSRARPPAGITFPLEVPTGTQAIEIGNRCVVLAGLNGSGKSRTLASIAAHLGDSAVLIRVHELCEWVRSILRSRTDIADMEAEFEPMSLDAETRAALCRIIGKDYDDIEWFALELDSQSGDFEDWPFIQDGQPIIPHFRLKSDGLSYSSLDMGLGELSVHISLWALWQHRGRPSLTLLLDEPDAYLPPRSQLRLLGRLLELALKQGWCLVISTHSEGVIEESIQWQALVRLVRTESGVRFAYSAREGGTVADGLISASPVESILFVEDESGAALTRAIVRRFAPELSEAIAIIWKDGDGYLSGLSKNLPRNQAMPLSFALVYDGDLRGKRTQEDVDEKRRWRSLYLPTSIAPDGLFRSLKHQVPRLADRVNQPEARIEVLLDGLQGEDDHDWVNKLCEKLAVGRVAGLVALADLWVDANQDESLAFAESVRSALGKNTGAVAASVAMPSSGDVPESTESTTVGSSVDLPEVGGLGQ